VREFSADTALEAYWAASFVVSNNSKNVLTNAVKTGMEVADDVLEGRSLKESAKRRVPAGIKRTVRGLKVSVRIRRSTREDQQEEEKDTRRVLAMASVHKQSGECTKSELDLFSVPPTQRSMEQGSLIEYHPLTTVADGSPIEFDVGASGEDYIDFANTVLYVKAKITRADGTNLAVDSPIGPSNLFLHSLFTQVDVSLNGTLITASTNTYPYRAMMETLLCYGENAKRTQLTSGLFYKYRAGRMDSVDLADNAAMTAW